MQDIDMRHVDVSELSATDLSLQIGYICARNVGPLLSQFAERMAVELWSRTRNECAEANRFLKTHGIDRELPYAQLQSIGRVIMRQGYPTGMWDHGYIVIEFPHIFIGVEKDGYAHS